MMFSFSAFHRPRRDTAMESHYDEKKPRKLAKFLQALKSCFGHGSTIEVDIPSRDEYQRASEPSTGFGGEEIYGIQAEYLDEDDMAWGKPKKPKKQARRNYGSYAR